MLYLKYEEFTKSVFKFIVKSGNYNKLKYIRLKIHKEIRQDDTHGMAYRCTVRIFLDQILFNKRDYSEYDIKGYIVFVVAHELSHLLQSIDIKRYHSEKKYRNFIEASADIVALEYIKEYYDILKENIGYFSLDVLMEPERNAREYLNKV